MLTITDINGNTEGLTGYKGLKRTRNVNGEKTLSFIVLPTLQNQHSFDMVQEESIVEFDGETYRIKQMSEKPRGPFVFKEVAAIHTFFDLIDDFQYDTYTGSMTFNSFLQFVLGGTGYTWDIIDTFYAQDFENFGNDNRLALYQEGLKRYVSEFTLNGTHLTFRLNIGNATDFQFRYNYNIKTLTRSVNTNNLSTYIKGFGKKNEDGSYAVQSEYTSPNASIFGIRHAKPIYDERYTTIDGLNVALISSLKDVPDVSITIDFIDLRRAGFPFDVANEGDNVFLIYEPMNLDLETRIIEITEEFTESNDYPIKTDVTLANYKNNMADEIVDFKRTQKTVSDIVEGNKKLPYSVLDDAVKRATEALQSAQTELEFNNGIIARSKDNPNHMVLFNSSGIGISLDGGNTFSEAITHLGVNTSVLTAGQINANNINVKGGSDDSYTLVDANGTYIKGGAITIERQDGYKVIMDGVLQNSLSIQGSEPPFQGLYVEKYGQFYRNKFFERYQNAQRYVFKHDSRYIRIICNMFTDGGDDYGNVGNMAFDLYWEGFENDGGDISHTIITETRWDSDQGYRKDVLIDIGVPTGNLIVLYWRLWPSVEGFFVYGNIRYLVQEG